MPERYARLIAAPVVWSAESPRMRELKADEQIRGRAVALLVRLLYDSYQLSQARLVLLNNDELIRIRPTVRLHSHCLATANQLGSAFPEPPPAPAHFVGHAASRRRRPNLPSGGRPRDCR